MRTGAVGVAVCLAAVLLPLQGWWITGGTALVTVFLAVGYVFTKRVAVAVPLAYSVLDALGFAMLQSASVGGSIIRGAIDALNDITKDDAVFANCVCGNVGAEPVDAWVPGGVWLGGPHVDSYGEPNQLGRISQYGGGRMQPLWFAVFIVLGIGVRG